MDPKDEIKQRLDLCDVIAEYITLKPAGTHAMKAVCPFHSEKTPSFHVSRDKQIWRCFGCSLGGDMFSFVQQMEGVDFPEALRILGKKAGVEIARFDSREANEKQRVQQLQAFAAAYFNKVLRDATYAQVARDYVSKRGIDAGLVEKFQLGYAPDEWDALCKIALQKGFSESELLSGGLALRRKSGSGVIDRFRHRLMVPLRDVHGNVVGFTGRVLRPEDTPKYMNSPETVLYKKSQMLYGLDVAKLAIRKADRVIIMEGNLDVVASHKAGVENVVAASGTALTEFHIDLLKRFTHNYVFCFDADAAGFAAAERGIVLAQSAGVNVSVLFIPDGAGKDPDDVVQKDPALWRQIVEHSVPIMEWYFAGVVKGRDFNKVEEKKAVKDKLLPVIARLADFVEREHWLQRLASILGMELAVLRAGIAVPGGEIRNPKTEISNKAEKSKEERQKQNERIQKPTRAELAARLVLSLCINDVALAQSSLSLIDEALIPEGALRALYKAMRVVYTERQPPDRQSYYALLASTVLDPDTRQTLDALALEGEQMAAEHEPKVLREQLQTAMTFLRGASKEEQRRALLAQLRDAELVGDSVRAKEILNHLDAIV